jgi:hypothetical protein
MKNIHLIPTDKPSRLYYHSDNILRFISDNILFTTSQHIYITSDNGDSVSDEGVHHNYGSLVLDINNEKVFKTCVNIISGDDIQKIILTTDPTLIADGVQSIDDEFLEWFVRNPSCEFVNIESYKIDKEWDKKHTQFNPIYPMKNKYKIIIPQEEPKQANKTHYLDELPNMDKDVLLKMWNAAVPKLEPKQETLEEAAEQFLIRELNLTKIQAETLYSDYIKAVVKFHKWQQEQDKNKFSKEDLQKAFQAGWKNNQYPLSCPKFEEWFEQFSKLKNG